MPEHLGGDGNGDFRRGFRLNIQADGGCHLIQFGICQTVFLFQYPAHACGLVPAADNADTYTDGTYTASAQGCLSEVGVTVTITGGKVTDVDIDASGETPELGGNAAAALAEQLTEAGTTTGVDAVAGATMTSDAVFTAMDDCLSQAQ